jgi:hypothetical protein
VADKLHVTMERRPLSPRFETTSCRHGQTGFPPNRASVSARPRSLPTGARVTPRIFSSVGAMSVADRSRIVETRLEGGPDGGHEVCGIGAAEAAMMTLPLQKGGIGYGRAANQRLVAARRTSVWQPDWSCFTSTPC